jgi:hypothetical protein
LSARSGPSLRGLASATNSRADLGADSTCADRPLRPAMRRWRRRRAAATLTWE